MSRKIRIEFSRKNIEQNVAIKCYNSICSIGMFNLGKIESVTLSAYLNADSPEFIVIPSI